MNTTPRRPLLAALLLTLFPLPVAAISLTVNPNSVSNTFPDTITLTISQITNREPVTLEKYLDANRNGTIDPGEPLLAYAALRDGDITTIGGVRNSNVPGDDDLTPNGQITVVTSLGRMVELERGIGTYLYRAKGDTLAPAVTAPLTLTASPFPQSVSGSITNTTGAPVPFAGVAALQANGEFIAGCYSDASAAFSLPLPVGDYQLISFAPGHVANMDLQPQFTLANNTHLTANLPLATATRSISGSVLSTTRRIPGAQIFAESDTGEITLMFSDLNGNFTASVSPGNWLIEVSEISAALWNCLSSYSETTLNTSTGNVAGITLDIPPATSLIHGTVRDSQSNPIPGLSMNSYNPDSSFEGHGLTDSNGHYCLGAGPGNWSAGASDVSLADLNIIIRGTNVTLTVNQALQVDFSAILPTAHIFGIAQTQSGSPLGDIQVLAARTDTGDYSPISEARTAQDGSFDLPVFAGQWQISLETFETADRGCLAPRRFVTISDGVNVNNFTLIAPPITAQISGRVTNHLGQPFANLEVYGFLDNGDTHYNSNGRTDTNGNYSMPASNGSWRAGIPSNQIDTQTYVCPPETTVLVSGPNHTLNFLLAPLSSPSLVTPSVSNGTFRCNVQGQQNVLYQVFYTENLDTNRTLLGTYPGPTFQFTDPAPASHLHRFYQVKVQ